MSSRDVLYYKIIIKMSQITQDVNKMTSFQKQSGSAQENAKCKEFKTKALSNIVTIKNCVLDAVGQERTHIEVNEILDEAINKLKALIEYDAKIVGLAFAQVRRIDSAVKVAKTTRDLAITTNCLEKLADRLDSVQHEE